MPRPPDITQLSFWPDADVWPCTMCPWAGSCNAKHTSLRCQPKWPSKGAGQHELHPLHIEAMARYTSVGGFDFPQIRASRSSPTLPAGVLAVANTRRTPTSVAGWLAVKASSIESSGNIIPCRDLLRELDADPDTNVLVEWYDEDSDLERLDARCKRLVPQLPFSGYALHATASYSTYRNRAYFHARYSMNRSLQQFQEFVTAGIPCLPTLGPVTIADARDYVDWLNAHPWIHTVGLDLSCSMKAQDHRGLAAAKLIDAGTGGTLRFLVNGPASEYNIAATVEALDADRVTISNSRAAHAYTTLESGEDAFQEVLRKQTDGFQRLVEANQRKRPGRAA